ncbi:class II aldolase/adducin family protein [Caldicellulosiruptor kronotskyensis 2002]|uniref:Class II aldolase/adducin family protein n=1 Tax=Caldicellulosiruptor kronotskyensis (strain DSM 18902 / VKM B-2412 / 2002) TaxID=632348 RepID=E4SGA3_CALK2|nr:class II aldolase/adducin family protein [Caldicellulosiruptor kronotskyensis]ADQ46778.1 class II aldolase/adducin family protein [Caldicellulosiruptor kronotskyensis 2002]
MERSKTLQELVWLCQKIGRKIDYVQGGGGNISVKLDSQYMAIKASGFRLDQVTEEDGYVIVDYQKIKSFYENVNLSQVKDYEKESSEVVQKSVLSFPSRILRPSVEVGFHSILDRYVIHSHSVYANILTCSREGKCLCYKIFEDRKFNFIWIPYINPGFSLTIEIANQLRSLPAEDKRPKVIFMENHGLIVSSDNLKEAYEVHERVNLLIKRWFKIRGRYPSCVLKQIGDNRYQSRTRFILDFIKSEMFEVELFEKYPLYPDQLVYINSSLYAENPKIEIDLPRGRVIYNAAYSEALATEETLLAYLYVISKINKFGLTIKTMSQNEMEYIKNWESEKYRKELLKKMAK